MINILSYVGMNMHSEVCLWTLLGLVRTIFDATLFRVNANLKQVWQMSMPIDLSMPVQQLLRTMISGVMLVQCFTVYVYLASYIVLLYPVFLEERPNLVLPWLLLAATRQLLCELTSLALGLGTCVFLGPAKTPCIKFVIVKLVLIMPAFYMWMLVFGYYHTLNLNASFKSFKTDLSTSDHDYGLELAIRRRKTKSLFGEDLLRSNIVANLYGDKPFDGSENKRYPLNNESLHAETPDTSVDEGNASAEMQSPISVVSNQISETGSYEDWYGSDDVVVPRDADRILEQFVLMMLRIGAYMKKENIANIDFDMLRKKSSHITQQQEDRSCTTISADDTDTPSIVGSSRGTTASYVRDYPQIFMKRPLDLPQSTENKVSAVKTVHSRIENDDNGITTMRTRKRTVSISPNEKICVDIEETISKRINLSENNNEQHQPRSSNQEKKQRVSWPSSDSKRELDINSLLSESDSFILKTDNEENENNNEDSSSTQKHKKNDR